MTIEFGPKTTGQESYEASEIFTTDQVLQELGPDVQAKYEALQNSKPPIQEVEE